MLAALLPWLLLPLALSEQVALKASVFSAPANELSPTHVAHHIELGGALTRAVTTYTLVRSSRAGSAPANSWVVGVKGQQGFLEAQHGKMGQRLLTELTKLGTGINDVTFYAVNLTDANTSGASTIVSITSVTTHQTVPKPRSLVQVSETMGMSWTGDLLDSLSGLTEAEFGSVQELKVRLKLPTPRIIEYTTPEGFESVHAKGGATISFTSKPAMAEHAQIASVHYVQPEAVVSIRKLDRLVELSHWGANLAVQDGIDLFNSGPELKGHFSRLEHQRASMNGKGSPLAISSLGIVLPPRISSPYFVDIVGNVSTSRFRPSTFSSSAAASVRLPSQRKQVVSSSSLLELTPRYPLMGGWNYTFTIGYDAPLGDFLKRTSTGSYVLALPFLTPIKDVAIDDATLRIRLPERARNIRVHLPFPVDSLSFPTSIPSLFSKSRDGLDKTYLDTIGRPTIVIKKQNCTDRHGSSIIVEYDLPFLTDLLQKPLSVAAALSTLFLFIILIRKLEWRIGGTK